MFYNETENHILKLKVIKQTNYFLIKFILEFDKELIFRLYKITYEKRMIVINDNAIIINIES